MRIPRFCVQHVHGFNGDYGVLDVLAEEMIRVEGSVFWRAGSSDIASCGLSMSFASHFCICLWRSTESTFQIQVYWRWKFDLLAALPLSAVEQRCMCLW